MRVAIYTRVSTDKQTDESQLQELRLYCQRRGWSAVQEFRDVISGAKFTRRGLDELMSQIRKGKIQTVITFKLDRLGRSLSHLALLIGEMTANNTALICTSQGIDTTGDSAVGRLQLGVLMAVAEFEREVIRERVNAGLAAAKARGVKLGRRETLSKHAERVRELLAAGKGVRAIARELGLAVGSAHKLVRHIKGQTPRT